MRLLQGIRVLDLGTLITGPFASMLLAELGADVIKVERPGIGDPFRSFWQKEYGSHFQAHNRNKRSITIDYATSEGLAVFRELARSADVLIINSRPGIPEKLGIGYPAMHELNPRLVYCSITGFGADGPYAKRPALDTVGQALSGWSSRHRQGDDPRVAGPAISDPITGHYAALGVLGALYERTRSGSGHLVEVNMLEATMGLVIEPLANYLVTGEVQPVFERGAMSQAYNLVCQDGKRIGLHTSSWDKFWNNLCNAIGYADWVDKYPTRRDRVAHYDELAAELKGIFAQRRRDEWVLLLEKADVPFAPELEMRDLEHDPQIRHLGTFYEVTHPKHGRVKGPHRPILVDGGRHIDFRPPPDLGEHTEEVLQEIGLTADRINELRRSRVI